MFGKRVNSSATVKIAPPLPVWLAADTTFNPVNVGIFLAALLFGMNA